MLPSFLQRLDLDYTADERAVRRAYARELKKIDQETDLEGFQALRTAYESALQWLTYKDHVPESEEDDDFEQVDAPGAARGHEYEARRTHTNIDAVLQDTDANGDEEDEGQDASEDVVAGVHRLFESFMQEFHAADDKSGDMASKVWQQKLEAVLTDELFVNLEARQLFERCFAGLLVEGWKPGHELLFPVCIRTFAWDRELRLQHLGQSGVLLAQALHEQALFNSQAPRILAGQKELIQLLREARAPLDSEVRRRSGQLEYMLQCFPSWMWIMTDPRRLEHWRERLEALSPAQRQRYDPSLASAAPDKSTGFPGFIWFGVLMLIFSLARCIGSHNDTPAYRYSETPRLDMQKALAEASARAASEAEAASRVASETEAALNRPRVAFSCAPVQSLGPVQVCCDSDTGIRLCKPALSDSKPQSETSE